MNKNQVSKETFLIQLERLLYDIPKDERDEAMDYYRSYFDDAGVENEAAVLEELESPQTVAQSIREELNAAGNMTSFLKNPPQVRENRGQSNSAYEYGAQTENSGQNAGQGNQGTGKMFSGSDFQKTEDGMGTGTHSSGYRRAGAYSGTSAGQTAYRRYDQYRDQGKNKDVRMDKRTKLILFLILAVFTSPIWGAAASGILGVIGVLIASVVLLGLCSVGGLIGGAVCAVTGIIRICMLSLGQGLAMLGIGMFLIAAGGIGMVVLLLLCGRFLPWAAGWIAGLFRRLWKWGRSMA